MSSTFDSADQSWYSEGQVLYSLLIVTASLISSYAWTPPGGYYRPTITPMSLAIKLPMALYTQFMPLVFGLFHAHISLYYPRLPAYGSCSTAPSLLPYLFTWSPTSVVLCICMILGGVGRRLAFAQLGDSFTYEITVPKRLVTTGLYRYIQHPSYSLGLVGLYATQLLFLQREGGVLTCVGNDTAGPVFWICRSAAVVFTLTIPMRIMGEEKLLRKSCGKEWEMWHRQTARFIPGVV